MSEVGTIRDRAILAATQKSAEQALAETEKNAKLMALELPTIRTKFVEIFGVEPTGIRWQPNHRSIVVHEEFEFLVTWASPGMSTVSGFNWQKPEACCASEINNTFSDLVGFGKILLAEHRCSVETVAASARPTARDRFVDALTEFIYEEAGEAAVQAIRNQ